MPSDLTHPTSATTADTRSHLPFDAFATRVLYVVSWALAAISTTQDDFWWLLRAGQDIWHTGHVPLTDHYSHTAQGRYWSNHEWLWEATAYAFHRVGGMPLISAWTGAVAATTLWLMRRATRATGYLVPLVLGASMVLLSVSWTHRPQMTSMLFFALTVLLLIREQYVSIPLVFLVWANLHAQVVIGGLLMGAALMAALVEALLNRTGQSLRRARQIVMCTAASAVATLATPLGPRLWTYVLSANGRPGQDRIAEWATAFHPLISNALFWALLTVVVVLAARRFDRIRPWEARVPALATLAMAPMAILAVRNIPFFMVAAAPLLLTLLASRDTPIVGSVERWRAGLATIGAVAATLVALVWVVQPSKLAWQPVSNELAAELRACPGPLYNEYNNGAALIWWVPQVKVFADNRQDPYPADVIMASAGLDASTYPAVFRQYRIQCAYVPRSDALVPALRSDGWTPTYEDSASVVLVPPISPRATSATE